jgi:hypothetical protein
MIDNPYAALAIALGGALAAAIAAYFYTERQCRRRLAALRRQRPAHPAAPPLPRHLRLGRDRLIVVARARRPRNN